ncbi:hypothetical protein DMH17_10480 [Raoultella planticola]|nr:hypothetical protein [Raoultella planticola]
MSDFDMVGHRQVAFYTCFCHRFKRAATWFCRGRPQLLRKNHFYCIDLTPFFINNNKLFSAGRE